LLRRGAALWLALWWSFAALVRAWLRQAISLCESLAFVGRLSPFEGCLAVSQENLLLQARLRGLLRLNQASPASRQNPVFLYPPSSASLQTARAHPARSSSEKPLVFNRFPPQRSLGSPFACLQARPLDPTSPRDLPNPSSSADPSFRSA
jgi:hypothetical protein